MGAETRTGGREATSAVIGGGLAIAVGEPKGRTPKGFRWTLLSEVARLETGHTPSRRHPEYWDGDIPWIGIRDATSNHGRTINATIQTVTQLGIDNSSARILPAGTVCLSRTASVGYVVIMGRPMATSQDFVNWVCGPELDPVYLKYVFQADRDALLRFANGSTHQTIYFPEVKAFHALLPSLEEQRAIVRVLGALDEKVESNQRAAKTALELASAKFELACAVDGIECKVGDLATFHNRMRVPLSSAQRAQRPGPVPYYGATGVFGHVDDYIFDDVLTLVGEDGSVVNPDGTPVLQYIWGRSWVNNHAHVLTGSGVTTELLHLALRRLDVRPAVTGAVQAKLSMGNLSAMTVTIPGSATLPQLEADIAPLFEMYRMRANETATLLLLRDRLIPELLSGKLRAGDLAAGMHVYSGPEER